MEKAQRGAELFVFGLAKKVILADSIGALWTGIIGAGGVGLANVSTRWPGWGFWPTACNYTLTLPATVR